MLHGNIDKHENPNFLMKQKNEKCMETKGSGNWISFQKNVALTKYVHKYRQNLNFKDHKCTVRLNIAML